jgi:hypothetical protein
LPRVLRRCLKRWRCCQQESAREQGSCGEHALDAFHLIG